MRSGTDGAGRTIGASVAPLRVIEGGSIYAGKNSLLAAAREEVRRRSDRRLVLGPDLLAEPAWDMMLDLYIARATGRRVAVSSLCVAADVPITTALRWIRTLERSGFLVRERDRVDRRRSFVDLSASACEKIELLLRRAMDRAPATH